MSDQITIDSDHLETLLDQAAERGAKKALERVGLHDDMAGKDISDLRTLIDGWRDIKRTVVNAIVKWTTVGILGLIAAGWWMNSPKK